MDIQVKRGGSTAEKKFSRDTSAFIIINNSESQFPRMVLFHNNRKTMFCFFLDKDDAKKILNKFKKSLPDFVSKKLVIKKVNLIEMRDSLDAREEFRKCISKIVICGRGQIGNYFTINNLNHGENH